MSKDEPVRLVVVRSYFQPHQAHIDKGLLEANEIAAVVEGIESTTALATIGSTLLKVDEMMAKKARFILDTQADRQTVEAWTCNNCEAEVDEGFEVCWKCGAHYDAARRHEDP